MSKDYYDIYRAQKSETIDLIDETKHLFQQVDIDSWTNRAEELMNKTENDTFKVLVLGEFKRGKSTFINAMLGEEVLPAYSTPCTAVINEIKWDENKRAKLYFKENISKKIDESKKDYLDEKIINHINQYNGQIPPLEIDVKDLEKYVVIPDPAKDQGKSVAESPFEKVELYWPFTTVDEKGIKIIDSPGLNEHGTRTKVSLDYLTEADAIIFIMSSTALASQSEMNFINNHVMGAGHEDIFFLCNKFDIIRRKKEKLRVKEYANKVLKSKTKFGEDGIYFLSSILALDGRIENDNELLDNSGILEFEKDLERFLTKDRGRIKLMVPIKNILNGIDKARNEIIPNRKKMLNESIQDIEKKYEEIKPRLEDKEHHRAQIIKSIDNQFKVLENDLNFRFSSTIKEIVNDKFTDWVENYELESDFKFYKGHKKQAEKITEEITEYISKKFENAFAEEQKSSITPYIENKIEEIFEKNRYEVKSFLHDIDIIKEDMFQSEQESTEFEEIPEWQRLASAAGGLMVGGAGSALVGATMGPKEMLKSLIPNVALGVGMVVVGIANPLILVPTLLGAGSIQGLIKQKSAKKKIKMEVVKSIKNKVKEEADNNSKEAVDKLSTKFNELRNNIDKGLKDEIVSIRKEVDTVLKEKKEREMDINKRKKELDEISNKMNEISQSMNNMLKELNSKI